MPMVVRLLRWCVRDCGGMNQIVHGHALEVGEDVVAWALNFLGSYREALYPGPVNLGVGATTTHWLPPSGAHIKLNCDVGYLNSESYQVAVVA